jgi:hypothetical protein
MTPALLDEIDGYRAHFDAMYWAAAGYMDTLLRWKMEPEVANGTANIQPGV